MRPTDIAAVHARRVWDSRGRPTVEAEVVLAGGATGRAIAPAGASRGSGEATDRRDAGARLGGLDVLGAVGSVVDEIGPALLGRDASDQAAIDAVLDALDPSPTRARLGGNATVATSLAVVHAAAVAAGRPLWRHLAPQPPAVLPRPEVQIVGGGAHADRRIDLQDLMVVPVSSRTMADALVMAAEVYRATGEVLARHGSFGVADEGGHWPAVEGNEAAIRALVEGIERAGLVPGTDVVVSLDVAGSELERDGRYHTAADGRVLDRDAWLEVLAGWVERYPVRLVEDPCSERDLAGMQAFTARHGRDVVVVGDDLLVTSAERVRAAAAERAANAVLVKVNQAGTVTAARAALDAARAAGWSTIVSARSGETEDVSVAHLAVGWEATLVKVGSITRGERTAKWNELLRIAEALGDPPLAPLSFA